MIFNEKEYNKAYSREYNRKNRVILREKKKLQIANNPEYAASLRLSKKNWRDNNKGYMNKYNKNRRNNDLSFKLRMSLRSRLYKAVKGLVKQGSAITDLGCSLEEFKIYIQNKFTAWMTWENYGEWELDHIVALAKFDLTNREEFVKACHYTNYQPLWKAHNRAKRDK